MRQEMSKSCSNWHTDLLSSRADYIHSELTQPGKAVAVQVREEHWVIADLIGKGKHIRTGPGVIMGEGRRRSVDRCSDPRLEA
jgi:hypothetical protein